MLRGPGYLAEMESVTGTWCEPFDPRAGMNYIRPIFAVETKK